MQGISSGLVVSNVWMKAIQSQGIALLSMICPFAKMFRGKRGRHAAWAFGSAQDMDMLQSKINQVANAVVPIGMDGLHQSACRNQRAARLDVRQDRGCARNDTNLCGDAHLSSAASAICPARACRGRGMAALRFSRLPVWDRCAGGVGMGSAQGMVSGARPARPGEGDFVADLMTISVFRTRRARSSPALFRYPPRATPAPLSDRSVRLLRHRGRPEICRSSNGYRRRRRRPAPLV